MLQRESEYRAKLATAFQEHFINSPEVCAFAPGRVNLIGEHIDYNGGHVLPCALDIGTWGAARRRSDGQIRCFSLNYPQKGLISFPEEPLKNDPRDAWSNYPKAMVSVLRKQGFRIEGGFDLLVRGELPTASGLSSSASLEMLTGVILRELFDLEVTRQQLALAGQQAENSFLGVNSGIMDQFAIAMGERDKVMFLDTAGLVCEQAPLELAEQVLVISSSNRKRGLATSAYNERRAECEEALRDLRKVKADLPNLCSLSPEEFKKLEPAIRRGVCRRRARHAVSEEARTQEAFRVLKEGDLKAFGALMLASHESLRDDYEVSVRELDLLVELAMSTPGCLGSRMTGAGFGGCTVSLMPEAAVAGYVARAAQRYAEEIGHRADFYTVRAGQGAHLLV